MTGCEKQKCLTAMCHVAPNSVIVFLYMCRMGVIQGQKIVIFLKLSHGAYQ